MIEAKTKADIRAALGETVRVVGLPQNTKASPLLSLDGGDSVYCRLGGTHWPDELSGKRIVVIGEPILLSGPIYPVASRDEHGAWSQGVAAPEEVEFSRNQDGVVRVERKPVDFGGVGEIVIRVTSHVVAE